MIQNQYVATAHVEEEAKNLSAKGPKALKKNRRTQWHDPIPKF
jgi:hypothetical protein